MLSIVYCSSCIIRECLDIVARDVYGDMPIHLTAEAHTTEDFIDMVDTLKER